MLSCRASQAVWTQQDKLAEIQDSHKGAWLVGFHRRVLRVLLRGVLWCGLQVPVEGAAAHERGSASAHAAQRPACVRACVLACMELQVVTSSSVSA